MQAIKELLKQLAGIWNELGLNQKVTVMAAGFAVVAGLIAVIIWGGRTDYSLLYGNLDTAEAGRVTQALDSSSVKYKISQGGGAIYVPSSQVHQMRMQLATQGIPKGEGIGYELLARTRSACLTSCSMPTTIGPYRGNWRARLPNSTGWIQLVS